MRVSIVDCCNSVVSGSQSGDSHCSVGVVMFNLVLVAKGRITYYSNHCTPDAL